MINYLLNLKLVNGNGKFSVNLWLAGRHNNRRKCVNTSTIRKSTHKIFVFASAAKAASHCRVERKQKADFHRDT